MSDNTENPTNESEVIDTAVSTQVPMVNLEDELKQ